MSRVPGRLRTLLVPLLLALALLPARDAPAAPPRVAAQAAAVFEASTGTPVHGHAAGQRRMIASTTKMMTALVAVAALPLERRCAAPRYLASPLETRIGLRAGERMSVRDLLRALLLPSANDAAATLAVCVAGSREAFVARMNRHARRLGLRHTRFATPVGLDTPGNYSTAADLVRLALTLRRDAFLRRTVDLRAATLRTGAQRRTVLNRNGLVRRVPWIDGVKTGHTLGAGYALVASGTRGGTTFVAAVLGDPSEQARDADALALLRWAFASFRVAAPVARGEVRARPRVRHRPDERIDVVAAREVRLVVGRGARVHVAASVPQELEGPLRRGAVVGRLVVRAGGEVVDRVPLVTSEAVPEVGIAERAGRALVGPGSLIVIVAIVAGALVLRRRRSEAGRRRRADMEAA